MRTLYARLLLVTTVLGMAFCATAYSANVRPVVVASTNFPEQLILANIYADVLQAHDIQVNKRLNLGSREVVFPALKSGGIDVLPEYTGALLAYLTQGQSKARTQQQVLKALRAQLPQSIVALAASPAQDADALVVTRKTAHAYQLEKISDLRPVASKLTLGGPPEMKTRRDGVQGLKRVYGLEFARFRSLDAGGPLTQGALAAGAIDVARMFSTQGAIPAKGWVRLEDDKNLVPAQNLIAVARKAILTPRIQKLLNAISKTLTTEQLRRMNKRVSVARDDPATIASDWVRQHHLGGSS